MKVLITGGAGFIGSHLVDRCIKEGYKVTVLDNLSNSTLANLEHLKRGQIDFKKGDIRVYKTVKHLMRDVDVVFHDAAQVSIPFSIKDPIFTDDVNVRGTLNLLIAASEARISRFIFASSSAVYGDPVHLPLTEDHQLKPISPYAASKSAGEAYCIAFYRTQNLPIVCLRYFNVFGPRQRLDGHESVIPNFIKQLLDKKPISIYGDGSQTRDFVHVSDVVEANMLALRKNNVEGEAFNIGSGTPTSVLDLSEILTEVSGFELPSFINHPLRGGDITHSLASISKARKLLCYTPHTNIRSNLESLFEWYAEQLRKRR
jgi:UDP-glucose 4-epimerase